MKNKQHFKAGIVQFDVRLGNIELNLSSALKGIDQLKAQNANIALLPEMWSCGFDNKNLAVHAEKTDYVIDRLTQTASRYNMIIAGSLPESSGGSIFNTNYLVDGNTGVVCKYRKIHLFSPAQEDKYFCAGNRAVVCETSAGRVGLMTCYDLRFPELCRHLTLSGAMLILISAQWPLERINHWDILLQARAIENQVFIAAANSCGIENSMTYGGHSTLVSPFGEILDRAGEKESIISSELDFSEISNFRKKIPCLTARRPEAYGF